jgi:hypothetical protein
MLGTAPKNHPHQSVKRGVDDNVDDRETPPCVFDPLHAEFSFTLDVAASKHNAKCKSFCTLAGTFAWSDTNPHPGEGSCWDVETGLEYPWAGERVWCNPPFSGLLPWVERAWSEPAEVVVMLLPNNRQEQPFWQDCVEPYRDRPGSILTTRFIRRRRPFLHMGQGIGNRTSKSPPFGLVALVWDRRSPIIAPRSAR